MNHWWKANACNFCFISRSEKTTDKLYLEYIYESYFKRYISPEHSSHAHYCACLYWQCDWATLAVLDMQNPRNVPREQQQVGLEMLAALYDWSSTTSLHRDQRRWRVMAGGKERATAHNYAAWIIISFSVHFMYICHNLPPPHLIHSLSIITVHRVRVMFAWGWFDRSQWKCVWSSDILLKK